MCNPLLKQAGDVTEGINTSLKKLNRIDVNTAGLLSMWTNTILSPATNKLCESGQAFWASVSSNIK